MALLPELFVLGDSISLDYAPHLAAAVADRWRYVCKGDIAAARENLDFARGANGGDSGMVLRYLQEVSHRKSFSPEILLINAGLHDIKSYPSTGTVQVPLPSYAENLRAILALRARHDWKMVWVRITNVDDEQHNGRPNMRFHRYQSQVEAYNACADVIMHDAGVPVLDLNQVTRGMGVERFRDHVHFIPTVAKAQGDWLARELNHLYPARR